jgi:hypothetical protein
MLCRLGGLGGTQAEEVHEGRTRGDGLRSINSPASLPSVWVAVRAKELGDLTGAYIQDRVNQQLEVHPIPLRVQLVHGSEDVAHAARDLGAAPVASISERVGAPFGVALVLVPLLDPMGPSSSVCVSVVCV